MDRSFAEILAMVSAAAAPTLLGLAGALALAVPFDFFQGFLPTPIFALYIVFYWSLYQPEHLPAPAVFLIGAAQDLLLGGVIGFWALSLLVVHAAVLWQREFFLGRAFSALWTGFGFAALMAAGIVWLAASALYGRALTPFPFLFQISVTILLYPPIHWAIDAVRTRLRFNV